MTEEKNKYCDNEDICKLIKTLTAQYNAVIKQNASLQKEVIWQKEQMQKDNDYLIKLEEANMLYEQDIEVLKRQVEALQQELKKYKRAVSKITELAENAYCLTNGINKDMSEFAKQIQIKITEM